MLKGKQSVLVLAAGSDYSSDPGEATSHLKLPLEQVGDRTRRTADEIGP